MSVSRLMQMAAAGVGGEIPGSWDLSTASYDSVSFSFASQETGSLGVFFSPNGDKFFVSGDNNFNGVGQYSLSSAWDLSTASYDNVSFNTDAQGANQRGLFFKSDGTKMYVISDANNSIYQYSLSTAWDLSTAAYDSVSLNVGGQDGTPRGLYFDESGLKMFISGFDNDSIYQYSLSSSWDLSSASYDNVSFSVASQDTAPNSFFFKPDGSIMFMLGVVNDKVFEYSLSSPFDLTSASYSNVSFDVSSESTNPTGLSFKGDGTKMFVSTIDNESIFQYSISL